ncbi:hypothetical protein JW766_02580 [Candidatus Dojkabacteria bacterium]|nr:hypothetical protein [Candidatus Dojkabacteria bacterium]
MIEQVESAPRRCVCYSNEAMKYLGKFTSDRAEGLAFILEEKIWAAQQAGANSLSGWRLQRTCALGPACYVIQGKGFGALVQFSMNWDEPVIVHRLANTANDIMRGIGRRT